MSCGFSIISPPDKSLLFPTEFVKWIAVLHTELLQRNPLSREGEGEGYLKEKGEGDGKRDISLFSPS
jgi:hypothetical protein